MVLMVWSFRAAVFQLSVSHCSPDRGGRDPAPEERSCEAATMILPPKWKPRQRWQMSSCQGDLGRTLRTPLIWRRLQTVQWRRLGDCTQLYRSLAPAKCLMAC